MRKDRRDTPTNSHARIRAELLQLYGYVDMLTGEEIPNFKAGSFHHIDKDEFGGAYTVDNGAMLLWKTHQYIHNILEANDPELFDLLTECLILYKYCLDNQCPELVEQFQREVQPEVKKLVLKHNKKK